MPPVIFVTAFDAYAVQAFEVNAVDYVLKPFDPERLQQAVERRAHAARAEDGDGLAARLEARLAGPARRAGRARRRSPPRIASSVRIGRALRSRAGRQRSTGSRRPTTTSSCTAAAARHLLGETLTQPRAPPRSAPVPAHPSLAHGQPRRASSPSTSCSAAPTSSSCATARASPPAASTATPSRNCSVPRTRRPSGAHLGSERSPATAWRSPAVDAGVRPRIACAGGRDAGPWWRHATDPLLALALRSRSRRARRCRAVRPSAGPRSAAPTPVASRPPAMPPRDVGPRRRHQRRLVAREIPGLGHSSPVVWDNRVFVTSAVHLPAAGGDAGGGGRRAPSTCSEGGLDPRDLAPRVAAVLPRSRDRPRPLGAHRARRRADA